MEGANGPLALSPCLALRRCSSFYWVSYSCLKIRGMSLSTDQLLSMGKLGSLIFEGGTNELDSMTYIGWEATQITRLLFLRNPDKLHIRARLV